MKTIKWTFYITALVAMVLFAACKKEDTVPTSAAPILLDCNFAKGDTTLVHDPDKTVDYIIDCKASVEGTLTIEPGTVIQFKTDAGLVIQDGGTIAAVGTASGKIVLEGENATKGSWAGIMVYSNDVANKLTHVDIKHGGGDAFNSNGDLGNIIVYADARLTLQNVLSELSATYGLNAPYSSSTLAVSNSVFTDNTNEPVQLLAIYAHQLQPSNDFTGNGNDVIKVLTRTITEGNETWQKLNVPYFITADSDKKQTVRNSASLTIAAGTTIIFDADCGLQEYDGYLKAIGTAAEPILFTGLTKQAGAWKGLLFRSNNLNNQLDHVTIEYTGSGSFNSNGDEGAIIVWADAYLSISNSTLTNSSADCAINAPYSGETVVESNNTYTGFASNYCD